MHKASKSTRSCPFGTPCTAGAGEDSAGAENFGGSGARTVGAAGGVTVGAAGLDIVGAADALNVGVSDADVTLTPHIGQNAPSDTGSPHLGHLTFAHPSLTTVRPLSAACW